MQQKFIHRANNAKLILFFAGWGADEHLFPYPPPQGYDFMLCFDYTNTNFDFELIKSYQSIRLIGWSMGVWVASMLFENYSLPWEKRVAINGTMYPKHDLWGIPVAVFEGTLKGFSPTTLAKFRRRMCGTTSGVKEFLSCNPYRPLENLQQELQILNDRIEQTTTVSKFIWDQAIVGTKDLIFPVSNQRLAWSDALPNPVPILEFDVAHYDKILFENQISRFE